MELLTRVCSLLAPPFCWACGADSMRADPLCPRCRAELRWLGTEPFDLDGLETWAPVAYEGPARALVRALKFRGAAGLAGPMAAQIAAGAPARMLAPAPVLVPVPLQALRARRRGFNQAERLAAELARRTGLEARDCMRRRGNGPRQVGRGRAERLAGVAGALELRRGAEAPQRAVLVDDVVTTGATLRACAAVLRAAGAREVRALAYAKTLGR
ncbi:MAG: ComF family protein [Thermoleophilaceae bacterium]